MNWLGVIFKNDVEIYMVKLLEFENSYRKVLKRKMIRFKINISEDGCEWC